MTQVALITGGAKRIGAEIAHFLHKKGYQILIHYWHSEQFAQKCCQQLNQIRDHSAYSLAGDLRKIETKNNIVQFIQEKWGYLDLLVNNASVFLKDLHADSANQWEINAAAPYALSLMCQPLLAMSRHQPCIINMSDIQAQQHRNDYNHYCASKAALNMYSIALAKQLAPQIRVNTVSPGPILWPEGDSAINETTQQKMIAHTLLKRTGSPEDIAQAVYYLSESNFITGQNLRVDGGKSLEISI